MSRSSYREYFIVGILVQTMLLTSTNTGTGIPTDNKQCMMDFFRAFPVRPLLGPWPSPRACENSSMSIQNSDNTRSQTAGWASVDAYFPDALIQQDAALASTRESGARTTMPRAEVASNQGAPLSLLTQMVGARRVLEFGTLAGYSTIWFARGVGG